MKIAHKNLLILFLIGVLLCSFVLSVGATNEEINPRYANADTYVISFAVIDPGIACVKIEYDGNVATFTRVEIIVSKFDPDGTGSCSITTEVIG